MGCETAGLAGLIATTLTGKPPAMLLLAALLFVTGLGQGLAMPTLVRMVTGRIAPQFSGMIAGVTSAALQISTALSVAVSAAFSTACWATITAGHAQFPDSVPQVFDLLDPMHH